MKKVFASILVATMLAAGFSYDFTVKLTPSAAFPFLSSGAQKYEFIGAGGFLDTGITLFDFLNVGPEVGFILLPKNNSKALASGIDPNLYIVPVGLQLSTYFYPFSRLELNAGIVGGAYGSFTNSKTHYAPFYRAFGDLNFRINTSFSVGLDVSWFACQNTTWWGNPGASGISAGIGVTYKISTDKLSGMVESSVESDEPVFPLLFSIYKEEPVGTIIIKNKENAEIRNVKVSFRAEGYTASELECGKIRTIRKNHTETLSLIADFNDKILRFSESGKISGEIVINYEILGDKRVSVTPVTISVYNRNTMRWLDPSMVASFVSTNAPEVLELSKYFVGVARNHFRTGLNKNMQFSMYLFDGIKNCGIVCEEKSDTPYNTSHLDTSVLDYVQYPYQTLSYRSGDKDDIAILFMSMLESVGIEAAFIPLEADFIVAVHLGKANTSLFSLFNGTDHLLIIDDQAWLPLSIASVSEGFMGSWQKASATINAAIEAEEEVDFIVLEDAWKTYPPSGFSSGESAAKIPSEKELFASAEKDMEGYISQEFGPQIAAIQHQIKTEGVSVTLYNRLGLLYVRAGLYQNAIPVYEISAKMGSVPAMNNLGNIYSLQKKYKEAKVWYEKVLAVDPRNDTARKNLTRIETELEK